MCVKGLKKDKKGFGFEYVTGNKLLSFIKPLMDEQGLLLKQEILSIDNERMDYKTKKGENKSEILSNVMMRFTWIDIDTGEKDENLFGSNGMNDWDKGVGSALTYGERYFILKYFHIATDEDDIDNPDRKPEEEEKKETAKPDPKKKTKLDDKGFKYLTDKGTTENVEDALKWREMTPKQKTELENQLVVLKAQ